MSFTCANCQKVYKLERFYKDHIEKCKSPVDDKTKSNGTKNEDKSKSKAKITNKPLKDYTASDKWFIIQLAMMHKENKRKATLDITLLYEPPNQNEFKESLKYLKEVEIKQDNYKTIYQKITSQ